MELDKNYKVRVTLEQSRKIQELLFALGGCWLSGSHFKEPVMLDADCLFLNKLMVLTCAYERGNCYFENKHTHTEIQSDDLIALLTDLSKSAENPLQGVELTPKFEAVEPVLVDNCQVNIQDIGTDILDTNADVKDTPKFEVGNKVYFGFSKNIEEIERFCMYTTQEIAKSKSGNLCLLTTCCHATQENYEMLCNLYPHIEFEQPPTQADIDNEAVDKLAEAMKNKLAKKREQGYHGWATCKHGDLVQLLINHVDKGDPIDVANFCAFLFARGEPLTESVLDE